MIVAASFCPTPPLLHPRVLGSAGLAMGSALRSACAQSLDRTLALDPEAVLVLGAAPEDAVYGSGDAGDLWGYGVPVEVGFDGPPVPGAQRLPLAHTLAAWLLDEDGFTGRRLGLAAGTGSPHLESAREGDSRWALLVMGDGSARRTEKSPGWYDPDAVAFDDALTEALTSGEGKALLDLDETVGQRVLATGMSSWRDAGAMLDGIPMQAELHFAGAPFGVFYAVASWVEQP